MKKLPASTLQETIVALTVVLICFSIGLMVFVNVMKTEQAADRLRATLLLKEVTRTTIQEKRLVNEEIMHKSLLIRKTITPVSGVEELVLLEIAVYKNNKLLLQTQQYLTNYKPGEQHGL